MWTLNFSPPTSYQIHSDRVFSARSWNFSIFLSGVSGSASDTRRQLRVAAAGRGRTIRASIRAAKHDSPPSARWRQRRRPVRASLRPAAYSTGNGRPLGRTRRHERRRPSVRDEGAQEGVADSLAQRRAAHEDRARHPTAYYGVLCVHVDGTGVYKVLRIVCIVCVHSIPTHNTLRSCFSVLKRFTLLACTIHCSCTCSACSTRSSLSSNFRFKRAANST